MDDTDKLAHMIEHWIEHNEEHAKSYLEWSKKAQGAGKEELALILADLSVETGRLEALLRKALKAAG